MWLSLANNYGYNIVWKLNVLIWVTINNILCSLKCLSKPWGNCDRHQYLYFH